MGILSFFGKKSPADVARKHAPRIADKRAYAPDRWDSIRAVADLKTKEAAEALLPRFTFRIDPGITDEEEKELAFRGIVGAGEEAVGPIVEFLRKTDTVAWPVRMLASLLPEERVNEELLALLATMDTEYARDPEKKIDLLKELEQRKDPRIAEAVLRFLGDVNESARFHAVAAYAAQDRAVEEPKPLLDRIFEDESARVRARAFEALAARGIAIPKDVAHLARAKAPATVSIDAEGKVSKV
ncbi:MAG: HEAT repeat domain-containing protein [Polyangiales bacterium]